MPRREYGFGSKTVEVNIAIIVAVQIAQGTAEAGFDVCSHTLRIRQNDGRFLRFYPYGMIAMTTRVFLRLSQGLCCAKYVHCAANGTNDGNTIRIGRSHTGNVIRIDAADSHAWQGFCRGYRGETIQADSRVGISL